MTKKLYIFKATRQRDVHNRLFSLGGYTYFVATSMITTAISERLGFKCFVVKMDIGQTANDILQAKLIIGGTDTPDCFLAAVMDDPEAQAEAAYANAVGELFGKAAINPKPPKKPSRRQHVFDLDGLFQL